MLTHRKHQYTSCVSPAASVTSPSPDNDRIHPILRRLPYPDVPDKPSPQTFRRLKSSVHPLPTVVLPPRSARTRPLNGSRYNAPYRPVAVHRKTFSPYLPVARNPPSCKLPALLPGNFKRRTLVFFHSDITGRLVGFYPEHAGQWFPKVIGIPLKCTEVIRSLFFPGYLPVIGTPQGQPDGRIFAYLHTISFLRISHTGHVHRPAPCGTAHGR